MIVSETRFATAEGEDGLRKELYRIMTTSDNAAERHSASLLYVAMPDASHLIRTWLRTPPIGGEGDPERDLTMDVGAMCSLIMSLIDTTFAMQVEDPEFRVGIWEMFQEGLKDAIQMAIAKETPVSPDTKLN